MCESAFYIFTLTSAAATLKKKKERKKEANVSALLPPKETY